MFGLFYYQHLIEILKKSNTIYNTIITTIKNATNKKL